jgi:hypothetical protein
MNCLEFNDRLQQQLDIHLSPDDDPAVLEHVATCATCRRAWDDMRLLSDALLDWCDVPEVDLAEAVVARYQAEIRQTLPRERLRSTSPEPCGSPPASPPPVHEISAGSRRPLHRSRLALLGLGGTVAALLLLSVGPAPLDAPRRRVAIHPPPIATSAVLPAGDPMMVALVRSAGSAYFSFAHEAALQVEDAASLVWPGTDREAIHEAPPAGTEPPAPWGQDFHPGLAPMRKEFRSAFDFLLKTPENPSARHKPVRAENSDLPHVG